MRSYGLRLAHRCQYNDAGHIFVSDVAGNRVLEFDENGDFVRTAIGPGKRPGELEGLRAFRILTNGSGMTIEQVGDTQARIQRYDAEMRFVRKHQQKLIFEAPAIAPKGNMVGTFWVYLNNPNNLTWIFNSGFKLQQTITSKEGPRPNRSRFRDAGYWTETIADNLKRSYSGTGIYAFDEQGRVYTGQSNAYKIVR